MRKSSKHNNGTRPSQRISSKSVITQLLVDAGIIGLIAASIFLFLTSTEENEYGIPIVPDMEQLLETATVEDKYCIIKFEAPYCFPCIYDKPVDGKAYFESITDKYVMYELNALDLTGEGPGLTQHYSVDLLPTWLVLNSQGQEVFRWESSGNPPIETLNRLEALREIATPVAGPIAFRESPEMLADQIFTLNWQTNLSYWEAIRAAEQLEPLVLESVWTQPDSLGTWTVCSGTYRGIIEARKSRLFHTEWREQPLKIVKLKEYGWQLPEN